MLHEQEDWPLSTLPVLAQPRGPYGRSPASPERCSIPISSPYLPASHRQTDRPRAREGPSGSSQIYEPLPNWNIPLGCGGKMCLSVWFCMPGSSISPKAPYSYSCTIALGGWLPAHSFPPFSLPHSGNDYLPSVSLFSLATFYSVSLCAKETNGSAEP